MLTALAFVPPADVRVAYNKLIETPFFESTEQMDEFLLYFQLTWIGSDTGRRLPKFQIELWNCYNSVVGDLGKTNNICEGSNRALNSLMSVQHPTIFRFIQGLKRQQVLIDLKLEKALLGESLTTTSSGYINHAARLKDVVLGYRSDPDYILTYLKNVSHNIQFNS